MVHYDGIVSVKRTFLWAERRMIVLDNRVEFLQIDRANATKIVLSMDHISLSPIIRHHGSFEFTIYANEAGYVQRIRLRTPQLNDTEKLHALILRVKAGYMSRPRPVDRNPDNDTKNSTVNGHHSEVEPTSSPTSSYNGRINEGSYLSTNLSHMYSSDNPHFSVNMIVVGVVLLSALIGPKLNSLVLTTALSLFFGMSIAFVLNYHSIDPPYLHIMLSFSPSHYNQPVPITPAGSASRRGAGFRRNRTDPTTVGIPQTDQPSETPPDYTPPRRSTSYVKPPDDFKVSLDDVEVQSNSGRSSINEQDDVAGTNPSTSPHAHASPILFSESSKFIAQFAAIQDYQGCYSIFYSMSESIIQILSTQPRNLSPPRGIQLDIPRGVHLSSRALILPDDLDCIRNEWNLIRNKAGLKVLTTKLSSATTRWPVISSVGTIRATVDAVYKSVSCPDLFKNVDEFGGEYRIIDYVELVAPNVSSSGTPPEELLPSKDFSPTSPRSEMSHHKGLTPTHQGGGRFEGINFSEMLKPETAPIFFKYQEMKSVWPVQPRDYLAGQSGFNVTLTDGRRGKMLISKSIDPNPRDPFPTGHEGFVRGSLTASAFLIIENQDDPAHSDVWTFLHCDMKGNLSGNGKVADFITQSQMPKFFANLETVSMEQI